MFDSDYPHISKNQRSKSQKYKKRYIESVVVNEELVEDEHDIESIVKRKPLKFSNISLDDDLPSKFSKKISIYLYKKI